MLTGEFRAIERIRRALGPPPPGSLWIGDDAAVVSPPSGPLLLAADAVVWGVHCTAATSTLQDLGWKAVVANVSDLAAMGGRPLHALVSVAGPPETDLDLLYGGIREAAAEYEVAVVGGDLSNASCLVVSVAVTGTVDGAPVPRSGARPGDGIWVTGPLGGAAAGGWRARPAARVAEGSRAREAGATAMIDVSDGFLADLNHLAAASGVGYRLDEVPVAPGASLEQALHGGEDYELVFTGPWDDSPAGVQAVRVGVCTADHGQRLEAAGWEHHFR